VVAEANLFSRMRRVFKSYANALVESAEDVEKVADVIVQDMQDDLVKASCTLYVLSWIHEPSNSETFADATGFCSGYRSAKAT